MTGVLNRRAFLTGVVATVTAAALPPEQNPSTALTFSPYNGNKIKIAGPIKISGGPYYLYPSQWDFFEKYGIDMRDCRLVEMIPSGDIISGRPSWRANDPTSHAPASFVAVTRRAPNPSKLATSQTALRDALTRVTRQKQTAAALRQKIGSPRSVASALRASRGRNANA